MFGMSSLGSFAGEGRPARITPTVQGSTTLMQDWITRSTSPGVFRAHLFTQDSDVNNFRFSDTIAWDPTPAPGSTGSFVRRNPTQGIMGNGCLEMEQLTNGNMNSNWWLPLNPALTHYQLSGAGGDHYFGQPLYAQFRFWTNYNGIAGTNATGRKRAEFTRTEQTFTNQEIVMSDVNTVGVFQMYSGIGPDGSNFANFAEAVPGGSGDYNYQPGSQYAVAPGYCSYQGNQHGDKSNCWQDFNNTWITYLFHVNPSQDQVANGTITVWAWLPGMSDYVRIMSKVNQKMFYDADKTLGFNAFVLWCYENNRSAGPAGQFQRYDQVILSTQMIPAPTV